MSWPKGKKLSPEHRQKISEALKGKERSHEHCRKISEALQGHGVSPRTRQKIGEAQRGEKHHNWKGGRTYDKNSYVLILRPNHPRADKRSGYVYEHILALEEKLGRALLPEEESHHINGVKDDNRQENLYAFPSKAQHVAYHHRLNKFQRGEQDNDK